MTKFRRSDDTNRGDTVKMRGASSDSRSSHSKSEINTNKTLPPKLKTFQTALKQEITTNKSDFTSFIDDDVTAFEESKSEASNYIDVSLVLKNTDSSQNTYETSQSNKLAIHDIFRPNSKDPSFVSKLLISGNGGVGKSTMLKHIGSDWATGRLWQDEIDFVFNMPLSILNNTDWHNGENPIGYVYSNINKYPLESYIHCLWGNDDIEVQDIHEVLKEHKVCILLDGFDEIARGYKGLAKRVIDKALELDNVIITARPNTMPARIMQKLNLTVENIGFTEEALHNYIKKNIDSPNKLLELLGGNTSLSDLCQTPINASMICSMWQDTEMQNEFGKLNGAGFNLSGFYQKMIYWLGKKFYTKKHSEIDSTNISPEKIASSAELKFLQELAFESLKQENKKHIKPELFNPLLNKHNVDLIDVAQNFGILRAKKSGKTVIDSDHVFVHSAYQEFLAAMFLTNKLNTKEHEIAKEYNMFVASNRQDMKYLNTFSHVAGLLSTRDTKVQQYFWEALTCNVDGIIEHGSENQVVLWLHALAEAKSGELHIFIPNLKTLINIIDLKVIQSIGTWSQELINIGYFSDRIMKYLDEVASTQSTNTLEATISSIKKGLTGEDDYSASDDNKTSSGEYENILDNYSDELDGVPVADIIDSIQLLSHFFHQMLPEHQPGLVKKLIAYMLDEKLANHHPELREESINAIVKIIDRSTYFNKHPEQLQQIGQYIVDLISDENMIYYVADNIGILESKLNIDKEILLKATMPSLNDTDSNIKPYQVHIARTLKGDLTMLDISETMIEKVPAYNSPRKGGLLSSSAKTKPSEHNQIPEKAFVPFSSGRSVDILTNSKKLVTSESNATGTISRFISKPEIPTALENIIEKIASKKAGGRTELNSYFESLEFEGLLKLQNIKIQTFQKRYYKFMKEKLEQNTKEVTDTLEVAIKNEEYDYIAGLLGLVKQSRIDQFNNSEPEMMKKLTNSVLTILEDISGNIHKGLLGWLNKSFKSLVKISPVAKDYFSKILTLTLDDGIIDASEAKFIKLCIDNLEISIVTTEDGHVLFENRKHEIHNCQEHEKSLNDIAYTALEKSSKKGDVLSQQYLNHNPLFPNSGEMLPISAFDKNDVPSLVSPDKIIYHNGWVISLMNYATVTGDEPKYDDITLNESFLLAEGRTAYGKYIAIRIHFDGQVERFISHPDELNDVDFRSKIFGDMAYYSSDQSDEGSRKRYFVQTFDLDYKLIEEILDYLKVGGDYEDSKDSLDSLVLYSASEMQQVIENCLVVHGIAEKTALANWQTEYFVLKRDNLIVKDPTNKKDSNVIKTTEQIQQLQIKMASIEQYDLQEAMAQLGQDPKAVNERKLIEADPLMSSFYLELRGNLNAMFFSCMVINTNMVANAKKGIAGIAASITEKAGIHVPFFGIGLDIISTALNAIDKQHWEAKIGNFLEIAVDATEMARVAEVIARKLALSLDIKNIKKSFTFSTMLNMDLDVTVSSTQTQIDTAITEMREQFGKAKNKSLEGIGANKAKIIAGTICSSLFSGVDSIKYSSMLVKAELICGVVISSHHDTILQADDQHEESKSLANDVVSVIYRQNNSQDYISSTELDRMSGLFAGDEHQRKLLENLTKKASAGAWNSHFSLFGKNNWQPKAMFEEKFIEKEFLANLNYVSENRAKKMLMIKIIMFKSVVDGALEGANFKTVEKLIEHQQQLSLFIFENCVSYISTPDTTSLLTKILDEGLKYTTLPKAEIGFDYSDKTKNKGGNSEISDLFSAPSEDSPSYAQLGGSHYVTGDGMDDF